MPAPVEDRTRRIALIETEFAAHRPRDGDAERIIRPAIAALQADKETASRPSLTALNDRWSQRKGSRRAASAICAAKAERTAAEPKDGEGADAQRQGRACRSHVQALRTLQGEEPLVHPAVDGQAVAEVVATWTGMPVGRMVSDEIKTVLVPASHAERARRRPGSRARCRRAGHPDSSRAGLTDPRKPIGVFLMAGTSGVGKTETALAARRSPLWRRAEPHGHQHERVQGGA